MLGKRFLVLLELSHFYNFENLRKLLVFSRNSVCCSLFLQFYVTASKLTYSGNPDSAVLRMKIREEAEKWKSHDQNVLADDFEFYTGLVN